MKKIDTNLVGMDFSFWHLETVLKNHGFVRGAMWDWDYAAYDHPLVSSKIDYYTYLRICTETLEGRIEGSDCQVKITDIFVTEAKYHSGLDLDKMVNKEQVNQALKILKEVAEELHVASDFSARDAGDQEKAEHRGTRKKH